MMFQLPSLLDRLCKPFACVAVQARRRPPLVSQEALSQTCWNPCSGRKLARDMTWQRNPEEGANMVEGLLNTMARVSTGPVTVLFGGRTKERTDTVCTRPIARLSRDRRLERSGLCCQKLPLPAWWQWLMPKLSQPRSHLVGIPIATSPWVMTIPP